MDDGSKDRTWEIIELETERNPYVAGIKLSRNCGHQNALLAGLFTAEGDALVSVDADLQDDIDAIEAMVDKFLGGVDVVYGVRKAAYDRHLVQASDGALCFTGSSTRSGRSPSTTTRITA